METKNAEFAQLSKGLKVKFTFQIMLLSSRNDLFLCKANHLLLEHQLLFGECKIHHLSLYVRLVRLDFSPGH